MKQDAAGATAWMDRMIAEGKFEPKALDGKNRTRLNFEGELISSLLASDPTSATARLSAIPEDQRLELIFQNRSASLESGTEKAYADMVRNCLPPEQQANAFPQVVNMAATYHGLLFRHPQECAAMAGNIQDAKRRAEILRKLEPMLNAEP